MLATLSIPIYLLVFNFGSQQALRLGLDLTEPQPCITKSLHCFLDSSHLDAHCSFTSQPSSSNGGGRGTRPLIYIDPDISQ